MNYPNQPHFINPNQNPPVTSVPQQLHQYQHPQQHQPAYPVQYPSYVPNVNHSPNVPSGGKGVPSHCPVGPTHAYVGPLNYDPSLPVRGPSFTREVQMPYENHADLHQPVYPPGVDSVYPQAVIRNNMPPQVPPSGAARGTMRVQQVQAACPTGTSAPNINTYHNRTGNAPPPDPQPQQPPRHQEDQLYAQLVALALEERCEEHRQFERRKDSIFHSLRIPGISVWDYIRRVAKYSSCSPECFIIAAIYIDAYSTATGIPITRLNVHRLVITAVMVGAKVRDDIYFNNSFYSQVGGVNNRELNDLELELLRVIEWRTWVESNLFERYRTQLMHRYYRIAVRPPEIPNLGHPNPENPNGYPQQHQ